MELFRRSLAVLLPSCAFFLLLDLNWRSSSLFTTLSPGELFLNAAFLVVALAPLLALAAALLTAVSSALEPARAEGLQDWTGFVALLYVNLSYLKFYLGVSWLAPENYDRGMWTALGLGAALLLLYKIWLHRWWHGYVEEYAPTWLGMARVLGLAALALAGAGWLATPGNLASGLAADPNRPPILLITCDSLSAREMSLYGYRLATTPRLEAFARTCHVFQRARTIANGTELALPAFLGRYPRREEGTLLTDWLRQNGYQCVTLNFSTLTPSFPGNFDRTLLVTRADAQVWVMAGFPGRKRFLVRWLAGLVSEDRRFFDLTSDVNPRDFNYAEQPSFPTSVYTDFAREYLAQNPGPCFLWLHVFAPHYPYDAPWPFRKAFGVDLPGRYDNSILATDDEVGRLLEWMDARGIGQKLLFAFSADHGESVHSQREAGWVGRLHGTHWTNRDVEAIPLLLRLPGQHEGERIETFVNQVDLAPTFNEILGLPAPTAGWQGESMLAYLREPSRMSPRLRISVPESRFFRMRQALALKKPAVWASARLDQMLAYQGSHRMCWLQSYKVDPEHPERLSRFDGIFLVSLFDEVKDPDHERNQVRERAMAGVVQGILESPLARFYQDGLEGAR